jgi:hypothetical protein
MLIRGGRGGPRALAVTVAIGALAASATVAQAGPNLLTDGDFESATPIATNLDFAVANQVTHNRWLDLVNFSTKAAGGPSGAGLYAKHALQGVNNGTTEELFQGVPLAGACVVPGMGMRVIFKHINANVPTNTLPTQYRVLGFGATGTKSRFAPWGGSYDTLVPLTSAGRTNTWASVTRFFTVPDPAPVAIGVALRQGFQGAAQVEETQGVDDVELSVSSFEAGLDVDPNTLSLRSRGAWVTAYITVPDCFDVGDIDPSTVKIGGIDGVDIPAIAASLSDEQDGTLMVKFDRQALIAALGTGLGDRTLEIEGLFSDGTFFRAEDTIRVIR